MQAQFYQLEDLKTYSKIVLDSSNYFSQDQMKKIIKKIIQNMQEMSLRINNFKSITPGNSNCQNSPSTNQIIQLIQAKIVQLDARRQAWEQTMALIFNQKDQIKKRLDHKLSLIDNFQQQLKNIGIMVHAKFEQIDQDRKSLRINIINKFQQVNQHIKQDLLLHRAQIQSIQSKLNQNQNQIKNIKSLKNRYQKNNDNFNFNIKIQDFPKNMFKISQIKNRKPEEQYSSTIFVQEQQSNQNIKQKNQQPTPSLQLITPKQNKQINKKVQIQEQEDVRNREDVNKNMKIIIQNFHNLENMKNYITQNEQVVQSLQKKIIKLGQKLQILQNKVSNLLVQNINKDNIPKHYNNSEGMSERNRQIPNSPQRTRQLIQYQSNPRNYLQMLGFNIAKFRIQQNLITYIQQNINTSCILLGNKSMRNLNMFTIQIIKTLKGYLGVGIADQRYHKIGDLWGQPNFFIMRGHKGQIYQGPNFLIRQTGTIFKPGDKISVKVNFKQSCINWYVNGFLRDTFTSTKLNQNAIVWMPVIRFFSTGDTIRWIYQQRTRDHI